MQSSLWWNTVKRQTKVRLRFLSPLVLSIYLALLPGLGNCIEYSRVSNFKNPNPLKVAQVQVKKGENLSTILGKVGFSRETLQIVFSNLAIQKRLRLIHPDDQLLFLIGPNRVLLQICFLPVSGEWTNFPLYKATFSCPCSNGLSPRTQLKSLHLKFHGSIYQTIKEHGLPNSLASNIERIYRDQIDFKNDFTNGDKIVLVYSKRADRLSGKTGYNIEAVSIEIQHHRKVAFRFPVNNHNYYFNQNGGSLDLAFSKFPLEFTRISSYFSLTRVHPITHKIRPHYGIDLAAPIGRPVYATGNGIVKSAGPAGGYGNLVILAHGKICKTYYAHLSRFASHLHAGEHLLRGQVIGYVGQTGVATGPHLHYEIRINDKPVDPLKFKRPRLLVIPPKLMSKFRKQRNLLAQHLF